MEQSDNIRILKRVPFSGVRKVIAANLEKAKDIVPTSSFIRVNTSGLARVREALAVQGHKVGYTPLFFKITAYALGQSPFMNASLVGSRLELYESVNIGMAVATGNGLLVVPVIRDVDRKNILEIAGDIKKTVKLANENQLQMEDFEGATFSISNLGMYHIDGFAPVVVPPQVAILGIGNIKQEPVVNSDGQIVAQPVAYISLNTDHRYVLGSHVMDFYQAFRGAMENPEPILMP